MKKVLCVCHGNMGRSPMMEAFLRHQLQTLGIQDVRVESAGVSSEYEGKADEKVADEMRNRGLPCDSHRSRYMGSIEDLTSFALIVCVGDDEARQVMEFCPAVSNRVQVVAVPGYWGDDIEKAYAACADHIQREMTQLAKRISSGGLALN